MQKRKTHVTRERRQKFGENLDKLCDICASDAIEKIQKKTDQCPPMTKLRTLPSTWTRAVLGGGLLEGVAWHSLRRRGAKKRGKKLR